MIEYEDECVGCPTEMGCMGISCPNRNVPHYYCDGCGDEVDILYEINGKEYCASCALSHLDVVRA